MPSPGNALSHLRITPDRIDDLIRLPADQVIAALQTMKPDPFFSFAPVVDGRSLPRQPFTPDAPEGAKDVPMLIGTNLDETTSLNGDFDPKSFSLDAAEMRSRLKSLLHLEDESKLEALIATYQKQRPNSTPSDIYFAVTTDADFRLDAITQAERKVAQRAAPAYMYLFEWPLPMEGGKFKSAHGAEIPFVFDNLDKAPNWASAGVRDCSGLPIKWVEHGRLSLALAIPIMPDCLTGQPMPTTPVPL